MDLEQHLMIALVVNRRANPNFSTKLMLDHLFKKKNLYVDEADSIVWSFDESVLSILYRICGRSSAAGCAIPCKRPMLVLMIAGANIAFCESRHKSLKCFNKPACSALWTKLSKWREPLVETRMHLLATSQRRISTPLTRRRRGSVRELLWITAADKKGD